MQTEKAAAGTGVMPGATVPEKSSIELFKDLLMEMLRQPFTEEEAWDMVHQVHSGDLGPVAQDAEGKCWFTAAQAVDFTLRCDTPNGNRLRAVFRRLAN
jgi:hypothetical protein